ncbi:MAG: carbohydrate ABC transporter substrate-binding protein [Clostridiaceae bacterium]|jgi:raffinose/stachyose/melibiose transport system substrate-binding protein|nr:carbohydrate ABC transporter substrate-binding protein [Clostridiaceae bacterium]
MKKRRVAIVFLSCFIIAGLLFTGCTIPGTSGSTGGTQTTAKKIIVFQSKVEITDQMEALAEEYKAETGVEVEVWGTTGDDYFQQLKTKLANNQGPTVFSLAPGSESEQMKNYLEDLSGLSFVGKIAEGMANVIDGKVVGIPYTVEGFGLVYNKSMISPDEVKDYTSFVKMMQDQKAKDVNGLSLSQESYFLIGHILNTPFALQADPFQYVADLAAGKVKMADTPEFQEFAKFYAAIRDYAKNPLEINYDKEIGDLATGKSAAIHQGNWCAGMFNDYQLDFELGMMPLPLAGNDCLAVSVPAAWYVNSQASDAEKQAGKEFLTWLYTSNTGKRYLMEEFGFIPVVAGMENKNLDVLSQEVAKYTAEGKTIPWPMSQWPAGIVDVYLVPVAEQFFTTEMTPEDFLAELDRVWVEASK